MILWEMKKKKTAHVSAWSFAEKVAICVTCVSSLTLRDLFSTIYQAQLNVGPMQAPCLLAVPQHMSP